MKRKGNYLIFENSKELYFLIENVKRKIMKEENNKKYTTFEELKNDIELKNKIVDDIYQENAYNFFRYSEKNRLFKKIIEKFVELNFESNNDLLFETASEIKNIVYQEFDNLFFDEYGIWLKLLNVKQLNDIIEIIDSCSTIEDLAGLLYIYKEKELE